MKEVITSQFLVVQSSELFFFTIRYIKLYRETIIYVRPVVFFSIGWCHLGEAILTALITHSHFSLCLQDHYILEKEGI